VIIEDEGAGWILDEAGQPVLDEGSGIHGSSAAGAFTTPSARGGLMGSPSSSSSA
jgi:hypothetical protein